jgi:antitoxin (DNA-binding transcriptional repressor) of toxin-antitoxin stability system
MATASIREVRDNLRALIELAQSGEDVSILRRGEEVARIVAPRARVGRFPDLTEFRASITVRGEPMSATVIRERRDARY